jgi:hypothetical protein
MQQHQAPRLPDEIWGLIVKALTRDGDKDNDLACSSLVALARASMKFASLALPELYSIARILFAYEAQDYYSSQPDSTRRIWARLWRSLLESCLGRTLFPYFLWVTRWDVALLREQIESIHVDYLDYFGHLLEGYESRHDGGRLVDRHAVTHNVVKMLADAMSKAANDGKRSRMVSLTTGNGTFELSLMYSRIRFGFTYADEAGLLQHSCTQWRGWQHNPGQLPWFQGSVGDTYFDISPCLLC